jgi:hypothetical protein
MPKFFLKWKKIYATRSLALASGLVTTTFIATPLTTGYIIYPTFLSFQSLWLGFAQRRRRERVGGGGGVRP